MAFRQQSQDCSATTNLDVVAMGAKAKDGKFFFFSI